MYWISTLGNRRTSHVFIGFSMLMLAACGGGGGGGGGGGSSAGYATSSAKVNWTAPTTRTDTTSLSMSQLRGFVIYFGTSLDKFTERVRIDDRTVTSYLADNLSPGQYYFAVSAVDTEGIEGPKSKVVSIKVE